MKKIFSIIIAVLITAIIVSAAERSYWKKHIQIVDVGDCYVDIDWGNIRLNDGHFSDSEVHRYEFNIN